MHNEKLSAEFIEESEQTEQNNLPALLKDRSSEEKELQQLKNENLDIENKTLIENKQIRKGLIISLNVVSILWLVFTGFTITLLGFGGCIGCSYRLSDNVAIAFITTSLGTVLGLWAIGLRYFFSPKK
ncbi:MAG: hypothetical protein LBT09_10690 [Planctomycetaceae bacterium]|jgi:hypothetical protein|nr:hypothetical protein [Planctomycetaceae bacterium]